MPRRREDVYKRQTQYITTTFSVDQDLDFVTKGLKVRGMVSFYNKTYAATYRSFSPYYYEMTDYTDNGDGTFDYNLQSIGTPGSSYLGTVSYTHLVRQADDAAL